MDDEKVVKGINVETGEEIGFVPEGACVTAHFPPSTGAPIERDLGRYLPEPMVASFLADLTALSKKYGVLVGSTEALILTAMEKSEQQGAYAQSKYQFWGDVQIEWDDNPPTSA